MEYKKVNRGDDLEIPAATYNAFIDSANYVATQRGGKSPTKQPVAQGDIVLVKNNSGADRSRFNVLALGVPIITPTDNQDEFINRCTLKGTIPQDGDKGAWGILLEPLANGQIGKCVVSGITVARINLVDKGHSCVDVADGAVILKSGYSGLGTILWVAGGARNATATGEQWAVIRLGGTTYEEPNGQYQFMVRQNVTQNRMGNDMVRAHPMF